MAPQRVLVTGGSGFIAGHVIIQLLEQGYPVRATIRSLDREAAARSVLAGAGMVDGDNLSFVAADLTSDAGWPEAVADVDFVLHVASPVQPGHVDNEDDLIVPAREGALRVLRAARDAGVKRVVLTSAFHAVSWGYPPSDHVFTENDWTNLDGPDVDAYGKSKTLAERAAWQFVKTEGDALQLVTLLPVAVMGPVMGHTVTGANHIVKSMLDGAMPALPNAFVPIVDVRDVAVAHILAMKTADAAGHRFLLSNGPALAMAEIAGSIRAALGDAAKNVPTQVHAGAAPGLGYAKSTSNEKARRVLGWTPNEPTLAVVAAAESMVAAGIVAA